MALSRRSFLKSSTSAAGAAAVSLGISTTAYGANEKARVAVIGLGTRGPQHLDGFRSDVVALCDCDSQRLEQYARRYNGQIEKYTDVRKLLENKDIDAVSIATPNHTHAWLGVLACQAGKDVYVEKPVSHNVWEGRQLVDAARKYDRIAQCGTQSRSSPSLRQAIEFLRSGALGEIQYAIGTCYKPRKSIGQLDKALAIPESIDYDLWCGPAEKRDIFRPRLHYDWHWDFHTGSGDMGNQGIHQMDIARWFLGHDTLSRRVLSIGGRLCYEDAGDTPNTQLVIHEFDGPPIIFEIRGLPISKEAQQRWGPMDDYRGSQIGVIVQCELGHVLVPSYTDAIAYDADGKQIQKWSGGGNHFANFIDAVKSRRKEELNAEIQEGHLSSALCHTGNISHRLGRQATAAEIAEEVQFNGTLAAAFDRMAAHLRANQVDVDSSIITLGASLEMDAKTERFTNSDAANEMLTRIYREGFAVPDLST